MPPGGDLDGLVLQDVGAVVTQTHLYGGVETELVDAWGLVHGGVERGLGKGGGGRVLQSDLRLLVRYGISHYFLKL